MTPELGTFATSFILSISSLVATTVFSDARLASELSRAPVVDEEYLVREDSQYQDLKVAEISIVEFGDLDCSCTSRVEPQIKRALKEYKGKISYTYRHFPQDYLNRNAFMAAEATEAAGSQGKFWEMRELLMKNQNQWQRAVKPEPVFAKYAAQLGLDTEKFKQDLKDHTFKAKVDRDRADGERVGIYATPVIFVNGHRIERLSNYTQLKLVIEKQLSASSI